MGRIDSAFLARRVSATFIALDRSASTVRTEHRFELEAQRADRFYVREYTWVSEEGIERPPVLHSGNEENGVRSHRLQGPVLEGAGADRIAVIDLGRVLEVNETETVELEHFFICTKPKNPGFVGHLASFGCEHITLRAVLPKGAGKRVRSRSFKSGANESYRDVTLSPRPVGPLLTPLHHESDWQEYVYEVPNPKQGERHRIVWDL